MRLERRLRAKTAIDMTPLIDVIMQLIIFFMITTTFKTVPGIELALPSSSTSRPVPQEELRILLVSADEIHVGSELTDINGLEPAIARVLAERKTAAAAVEASARAAAGAPAGAAALGAGGGDDSAATKAPKAIVEGVKEVEYQVLVSVLDALRKNGVDAVGLATKTAEAGSSP